MSEAAPASRQRLLHLGLFAGFSAAYFFAAITRASQARFWMDEVLAVTTARRADFTEIFKAIWAGAEFSPPTYHMALHLTLFDPALAHSLLAPRALSILAVYGAACVVLLLLLGRVPTLVALLGFGLTLNSILFIFAVQARPYGLVALCAALAFWLWDARGGAKAFPATRAVALWLTLSLCVSLHFYGVIIVAAVGICELLWLASKHIWRWPVWLALAGVLAPLAAWAPLARHLAAMNGQDHNAPGYYAAPTLDAFQDALLFTFFGWRSAILFAAAGVTLAAFALLARRGQAAITTDPAADDGPLFLVTVALAAIPFIGFALAVFVTGSFSARYVSAAALAPGLALALALGRLQAGKATALVLAPLTMLVLLSRADGRDDIGAPLTLVAGRPAAEKIVIGEGKLFIELWEAADVANRARLVFLARPRDQQSMDPTNENQVLRLAGLYADMNVEPLDAFLAQNQPFALLYRAGASNDDTYPALARKCLIGPVEAMAEGAALYHVDPAKAGACQAKN